MKAAIYVRISDDKVGGGLGVERQEGDCRTTRTDPNGWTVVEVYVDNDRSAYSGKPRPAYLRMLADADAGRFDAIVAWHTDRLHRSPRELEDFIDVVERRRLAIETVRAGAIDLTTPAGRMVARQLGAVARYESEHKADRQRAKHRQIALAGGTSGGGTRAFGFEADGVTVRDDEARAIRDAATRVLGGESLRGICHDLNQSGMLTPAGNPWRQGPLRRTLMSARLAGKREYQGEIVADAVWPEIIDLAQTVALRRLLTDPDRSGQRPARSYLLKGLLRCSDCDQVLVARPRTDGARCYVCASGARDARYVGCGKRRVLAEPVELFVTEAVFARLDSPDLGVALRAAASPSDGGDAERRADNALLRLDELAATYAEGKISMREWMTARETLERALTRARGEIASRAGVGPAGTYAGRGDALRQAWDGLDVDRRQTIVASVVDQVTVSPGRRGLNRFDPGRFAIAWRF
jgi:DNA invertase Pin-like site-specific DNA recombinase